MHAGAVCPRVQCLGYEAKIFCVAKFVGITVGGHFPCQFVLTVPLDLAAWKRVEERECMCMHTCLCKLEYIAGIQLANFDIIVA